MSAVRQCEEWKCTVSELRRAEGTEASVEGRKASNIMAELKTASNRSGADEEEMETRDCPSKQNHVIQYLISCSE